MTTSNKPKGQLAIQTLAMPADTNANGDIFGGWLVSQMDLAAGVIAKQRAKGRVVTVAIHTMSFHLPVQVGDLVCCYADLVKVGKTSMTIHVTVWSIGQASFEEQLVTEGTFIYVAIDDSGRPRAVDVTTSVK